MQSENSIPTRAAFNKNQAPESANTQRAKILGLLIAARGQWVPLSEISACACQYGARIFEARRLGFRIENRTKEVAGVRQSWFRLVSTPALGDTLPPISPSTDSVDSRIRAAAPTNSTRREGEETLPLFPRGDR
jgi:hypothetical protein